MYYPVYLTVNVNIEEKIQIILLIIPFPYLIFLKPYLLRILKKNLITYIFNSLHSKDLDISSRSKPEQNIKNNVFVISSINIGCKRMKKLGCRRKMNCKTIKDIPIRVLVWENFIFQIYAYLTYSDAETFN